RRGHDVLARERPGALDAARCDERDERAVLGVVAGVEVVELAARGPRELAAERAPRVARDRRDVRRRGRLVEDVVEGVVRAHPLAREARLLDVAARALAEL